MGYLCCIYKETDNKGNNRNMVLLQQIHRLDIIRQQVYLKQKVTLNYSFFSSHHQNGCTPLVVNLDFSWEADGTIRFGREDVSRGLERMGVSGAQLSADVCYHAEAPFEELVLPHPPYVSVGD